MSPFSSQPTIFLQSGLTDEFNPDPFCVDGAVVSAFHEGPIRFSEGVTMPLDAPPALPTDPSQPSFQDDHLGPPSTTFEGFDRVNFVNFDLDAYSTSFGVQPDDLYDTNYLAAYDELIHNNFNTYAPSDTNAMYKVSPQAPAPCDFSTTTHHQIISTSVVHLPPTPVDPSAMATYPHYFGCTSQASSPSDNASVASPPPSSPSVSSPSLHSSGSDDGVNYTPSSGDDEYRPTQSTSSQRQKKRKTTSKYRSPRRHSYKRDNSSRNIQCKGVWVTSKPGLRCPVKGCSFVQKNSRRPDFERHVQTHDRSDRWKCCGVGVDRAHLYRIGVKVGMTDAEYEEAGAYMFRGRLVIGGCGKTFSRRDALKRHVDNPNLSCVGHMASYF